MTDPQGSVLHQQALTVMGLFTGLSLTSLVLILNSPGFFERPVGPLSGPEYFQTIATFVALVGFLSSVALLAFLEVAGGMAPPYSFVDKFGTTVFFLSVFGFMGILPLILAPFTVGGAAVLLGVEIALLVTYFLGRILARPRGAPPAYPPH